MLIRISIRISIRMTHWLYAAGPLPPHGVNADLDADRTRAVAPGQQALTSATQVVSAPILAGSLFRSGAAQKCSQVHRLRRLVYSHPSWRRLTIVAASIAVQTAPWRDRQPSPACSAPASGRRHVTVCTSAPEVLLETAR